MFGKVLYDPNGDFFTCEFPIRETDGRVHICGKHCRDLVRHITRHHKIPVREYKKLLGLDMNEPLISRQTTEKLQKANLKYGTWQNLAAGKPYRIKKGQKRVQSYDRSEQTKTRLRTLKEKKSKRKFKLSLDLNYNLVDNIVNKN
jgi:hypothetical protein